MMKSLIILFLCQNAYAVRLSTTVLNKWPSDWNKVAIVYAGHHYKIDDLVNSQSGSDFRTVWSNQEEQIFEPFRKAHIAYDIYIHTWPSPISQNFLDTAKPKKFIVEKNGCMDTETGWKRGGYSKITGLELVEPTSQEYDAIILTRPDLKFKRPLTEFNIDPRKINLPFREKSEAAFKGQCRASDLMRIIPTTYLKYYLNGSIDLWSGPHRDVHNNPWRMQEQEYGKCGKWQDHFNFMSDDYGYSGGNDTPIGALSRALLTDEHGPYYTKNPKVEVPGARAFVQVSNNEDHEYLWDNIAGEEDGEP